MQLEGEHTPPACGVWRPAKHFVLLTLSSLFSLKKLVVEVLAETARTARETRAIPFFNCMVPIKSL